MDSVTSAAALLKKRKLNFSDKEMALLVNSVQENRTLLLCTDNKADVCRRKSAKWNEIGERISSQCGVTSRAGEECRIKWQQQASKVRAEIDSFKKTGGGSGGESLGEISSQVWDILRGPATDGLHGIDTSSCEQPTISAATVDTAPSKPQVFTVKTKDASKERSNKVVDLHDLHRRVLELEKEKLDLEIAKLRVETRVWGKIESLLDAGHVLIPPVTVPTPTPTTSTQPYLLTDRNLIPYYYTQSGQL